MMMMYDDTGDDDSDDDADVSVRFGWDVSIDIDKYIYLSSYQFSEHVSENLLEEQGNSNTGFLFTSIYD